MYTFTFLILICIYSSAQARIGETIQQCNQRYGKITNLETFDDQTKWGWIVTPEVIDIKIYFWPKSISGQAEPVYVCGRISYDIKYNFSKEDLLQLVSKNFPEKAMPLISDKNDGEYLVLRWENSSGDRAVGLIEIDNNSVTLECFSSDYLNFKALNE